LGSNEVLLSQLDRIMSSGRRLTAELVAHLGEVEERRLHLEAAYSSMFDYCLRRLGLSEDEAYRRIEVARLARRFPALFPLLASGELSLTVAALLKPHLCVENHTHLIEAVKGKTATRAREALAALFPKPDVPDVVRKLPIVPFEPGGGSRWAAGPPGSLRVTLTPVPDRPQICYRRSPVPPDEAPDDPHTHGGPRDSELAALGIAAADLIDFSVNTNPYGPSEGMREAIAAATIERYPDPTGLKARVALGRWLGEAPGAVGLGNGAAELLWTLARVVARNDARALFAEPTFSEFRRACVAARIAVSEWRACAEDGFVLDLESIARRAHDQRASIVYLCTPNTPTGSTLAAADVARFAEEHAARLVVLDQSFLSLSDRASDATVSMPPNVVRVRSLTKEHAIPGVRVGYLIARPDLVAALEQQRPAWMTSAGAQAAAIAACTQDDFVARSRARLLDDRARLIGALRERGLPVFDSSAPFCLLRVGDALGLRRRLLSQDRILVRDCTSFGLPAFVRLAVRPAHDVERLVRALARELGS
jgi:histidinol-phosphate/aromatic aminotransferase/cobyric acid decarboxylase-like protein